MCVSGSSGTTCSGFFYGTLVRSSQPPRPHLRLTNTTQMVPEIFFRVIHSSESPIPSILRNYKFTPALLRDFSRRKVSGADFPAIVAQPSHSVLGAYVTGLTAQDFRCLDRFEGHMYTLEDCECQILPENAWEEDGEANLRVLEEADGVFREGKGEVMKARVYVWALDHGNLEKEEWSYAEFRRDKMRMWVEERDEEYEEAVEVQRRVSDGGGNGDGCVLAASSSPQGDSFEMVEKTPEGGDEDESEELRTKRIVSVIAGIANKEEEVENLKEKEKKILVSAV